MRKFFCRCEVCKVEYMGVVGSVRCPDHREPELEATRIPITILGQSPDKETMPIAKMAMRYPRGLCQKCGLLLAKGSRSYCREHERERVKAWRESKRATK